MADGTFKSRFAGRRSVMKRVSTRVIVRITRVEPRPYKDVLLSPLCRFARWATAELRETRLVNRPCERLANLAHR